MNTKTMTADSAGAMQAQLLLYAADLQEAYRMERMRTAEVEQAILDLVRGLVHMVEARDSSTGNHASRVARYARAMSRALGWNAAQQGTLEVGAYLHDIGKIGIPDQILQKPGPLTAEEYEAMKTHVTIGVAILSGIQALRPALPYVAYHHEHYDGRGYPHGLAGSAIPVEGRLLTVADAFDVMTSARPYRPTQPIAEALRELDRERGRQFDPTMVDALQAAYAAGWFEPEPVVNGPMREGLSSPGGDAIGLLRLPEWGRYTDWGSRGSTPARHPISMLAR